MSSDHVSEKFNLELYQDYIRKVQISRSKVGYWIVFILVPLGSLRDMVNTPDQVQEMGILRLITTAIAILLYRFFFAPSQHKIAHHSSFAIAIWVLLLNETGIITSGSFSNQLFFGHIIVLLACGLLSCWSAKTMALMSLLAPLVYVVPGLIVFDTIEYDIMYQQAYLMAFVGALGTAGCHLETKLRQNEFQSRHLLALRTKQLEQMSSELQENVHKLQENDEAKTRFFANITHELKTPLTMILLPLDGILSNSPGLKGPTREKLSILRRQARQLLALVNDILTLAQLDHQSLASSQRPVDVNNFTRSLLSGYQPLADEREIELTLTGAPSEVVITIDPQHLQTILNNLLINAFKFSEKGEQINVHVHAKSESCLITVRDTGVGITKKDLPHIFDRFVQAESPQTRRGGGFGIGLSVTKELIELYNGNIEVESSRREGTKFTLTFPRSAGTETAPNPQNWDAINSTRDILKSKSSAPTDFYPPTNASRERVLIVEDNDELRKYLHEALEPHYTILSASSGDVALDITANRSPDLIISDAMMPGMSGFELIRRLRQTRSMTDLPCILLSARAEDETIEDSIACGANDYIAKPFSLNTLLARIEVQLRLKSLATELARERVASAMGALASGLAHELRNPLNVIINGLPTVRKDIENQNSQQTTQMLEIIERSSHKVSNFIDELIRFGTDELSLANWEPNVAILSAWDTEKLREGNPSVSFSLEYPGSIQAFGSKIDESIQHLLRNAITAAGPNGAIKLSTYEQDGGVSILVSDNGPGISNEVAQRIFDPFFTTQTDTNAAGLGLHMVQWVTRLHGGHINLETELGKGCEFKIWLPEVPQRRDKEPNNFNQIRQRG